MINADHDGASVPSYRPHDRSSTDNLYGKNTNIKEGPNIK